MSAVGSNRDQSRIRRPRRGRMPGVEGLESRALLAVVTETFQAPAIADLIRQADQGVDTAPAAIDRWVDALHSQLTKGPLADLKAGTVDGSGFTQEVASLVTSYQAAADKTLTPYPSVDKLVKLQGTRIQADVTALNQQATVGLLTSAQLTTGASTAVSDLTGGALQPLGTPFSAYVDRTKTFETNLNTLVQSLATTATTPLTISQVDTTLDAEAEAYRADMAGSLYVHPYADSVVGSAVTTLESTVASIARANPSDAQTQVEAAVRAFDMAILDTTGLFGPKGTIGRLFPNG